jgi:hypothetical protein
VSRPNAATGLSYGLTAGMVVKLAIVLIHRVAAFTMRSGVLVAALSAQNSCSAGRCGLLHTAPPMGMAVALRPRTRGRADSGRTSPADSRSEGYVVD